MIINWNYFLNDEAPGMRNARRFRAFIKSCFKPLTNINIDALYKLGHNFQKASLEHLLNKEYNLPYNLQLRDNLIANGQIIYLQRYLQNSILTYIYLQSEGQPPTYLYTQAEGEPPLYLYTTAEVLGSYDFIVWVPASVTFNHYELRALIYQYVDCTARFVINTY